MMLKEKCSDFLRHLGRQMSIPKKRYSILTLSLIGLILYYFSLPSQLFKVPYSTVLEDSEQNLLSASIATDGQWRFPKGGKVPDKFKQAIVLFEDKRFESHFGFDPLSFARAIRQNVKTGKVVSGGSTITMQVIRLARQNKNRTVLEKIIEIILATRLEFRYSKEEILSLYAVHAPFGGNVVGLDAACWRYFGRSTDEISWAEAALLAVLPNNPSLIHLGKNREKLLAKRNRLLDRLSLAGAFDQLTLDLAKSEALPENPLPLPRLAPHLLDRISEDGFAEKRVTSTIDKQHQMRTIQIVQDHFQRLAGNQIFNAGALVLEVKTGNVLAYVGNTQSGSENNEQVDVIHAQRSTGSILKPFLYAAMLDEGKMLQHTLVPDVPILLEGFSPKNFSHDYDGAVPANQALTRSLNIPAVHELREYRYEKFYSLLNNIGITTVTKPADHYGLSMILGGAEGTLWEITGCYASMARTLNNYFEHPGKARYQRNDFHPPVYQIFQSTKDDLKNELETNSWLSAASIYLTFDALKEVYRPGEGTGWKMYNSSKKIAWKTGTSFGFRDGWAVGVNPDYAVGVWVGNADGEGRPGLTGTETAAPIMFDIFSSLSGNSWFTPPLSEMVEVTVCTMSGNRAMQNCPTTEKISVALAGLQSLPCPHHKKIYLSLDNRHRVHSSCASPNEMVAANWFVLPPVQEFYFKNKNISYKPLPPFLPKCENPATLSQMDLVYPKPNSKIFVPRQLDSEQSRSIFEVAHRTPSVQIFWHLDGNFVGTTRGTHKIALSPSRGIHKLTLVDENGETLTRDFEVLSGGK
jgi:penicillin-binding protein 1C